MKWYLCTPVKTSDEYETRVVCKWQKESFLFDLYVGYVFNLQ